LVLVRDIESGRPQGSAKNKVTLAFDGRQGRAQPIQSTVVDIIFTLDETADDRIIRMVQQSKNSKNMIVVTDDRGIQFAVRAAGAKLSPVKDFLLRMRGESSKGTASSSAKVITQKAADKINEELKALWLKKNGP
jgi:predicted RNA-binding protein with PIN domain